MNSEAKQLIMTAIQTSEGWKRLVSSVQKSSNKEQAIEEVLSYFYDIASGNETNYQYMKDSLEYFLSHE